MLNYKFDNLIGIPFVYKGRDESGFDCFGLIKFLLKKVNGIDIPDYESPEDRSLIMACMISKMSQWERVVDETVGSIVMFRIPKGTHVGMYIGDDKFIHTWENSGGVVVERLENWKRRIMGFYNYVG